MDKIPLPAQVYSIQIISNLTGIQHPTHHNTASGGSASASSSTMDDTAVLQAFKEHCSPAQFLFCNKWYQDQQIVHYLSKWLPDLHATQLNRALAMDRILKLCFENTTYNEHGFYKHRVQIKKKQYVFYFVSKDKAPEFHSPAQKWLQEAEGNQIRKTSN